ncbi:MAG: deoxyribonuclease V [Thermodesulfobacteriota bacterium]
MVREKIAVSELSLELNPTPERAREIQRQIRESIVTEDSFERLSTVGGADLAVLTHRKKLLCVIVVLTYPELEEIERAWAMADETFPYIPGYLSFREGPAIVKAWEKLRGKPDVLMFDGQGTAHPRGVGIASHIGVALDTPAIGVAKKKLFGDYEEPASVRGSRSGLLHPKTGETIGAVLRTKNSVKPVFVSTGHRVCLQTAIEITLGCWRGYRVPEPTRRADIYAGEMKKSISQ